MHTICMSGTHECQKRAVDSLDPEFQMVVSHMWILGIEPGVSGRAADALPAQLSPAWFIIFEMVAVEGGE